MSDMKNLGFEGEPRKSSNMERVTSVEDLENRSWDRDSINQRFRDVVNAHDTIVNIISDIQSQIDSLDSKEEAENNHKSFYKNTENLASGDPKYHPNPPYQLAWKYRQLHQRESRWMAELMDLHRLAMRKFKDTSEMLLEENRTNRVQETLQEGINQKVEDEVEKQLNKKMSKLQQIERNVESTVQRIAYQQETLTKSIDLLSKRDIPGLDLDEFESILDNKLEKYMLDDGRFTIDLDTIENLEDKREVEEAAESAAEDITGNKKDDSDEDISMGDFNADEVEESDEETGFVIEEDKLTENQVEFLEAAVKIQNQDEGGDLEDIAEEADLDFSVASKYVTDLKKKNHEMPEILQDLG